MKSPSKPNSRRARKFSRLILFGVLALAGLIALACAFTTLRDIWHEQCLVTDVARQVSVTSGKLVKADAITEAFGLGAGANLADIDFAKKRADILARYPAIRDLHIRRRLPDRVEIAITERTPFVRLNLRGQKAASGRVADVEGVVFSCRRGTSMLPVIRETATGTPIGKRLSGRALAALRMVEACREPELLELGLLEIDTAKLDYLTATLGDYSTAKVSWPGIDTPGEKSREAMVKTLANLRDAIRSKVGSGAMSWNATNPAFIYSDTKEKIE
jgi:hypothetical protein